MLRANDVIPGDDDEDDALLALQDLELSLRGLRPPANLGSPMANPCTPDRRQIEQHDDSDVGDLRDLTDLAVWAVSTAKPGNGIEQILDGREDTYWQSDGPQPHTISAHFSSKVKISEVQLYLDYQADESYTPATLSVYAGCNVHDLRLVRRLRKLDSPQGWVRIPMGVVPHLCDLLSDDELSENELAEDASVEEQAAYNARRYARAKQRESKRKERMEALDERLRRVEKGVHGELEAMRDRTVSKTHMIRIVVHTNHQNGRDSHVRMVRALGPKQQVICSRSKFTSREFQMYETIR